MQLLRSASESSGSLEGRFQTCGRFTSLTTLMKLSLCHHHKQMRNALGDSRAIEPLIQILNEPDAFLRWSAVMALEKIGDERAVLPLERLAADDAGHFSITPDLHMSVNEAARKALRTIKERTTA